MRTTSFLRAALLCVVGGVLALVPIALPRLDAQQPAYIAGPGNGAMAVVCDTSVAVNITSATTTQLVALVTGKSIVVCGFALNAIGNATAVSGKFVYGTGTNCGTGTADLTGPFTGATASTASTAWSLGGALGTVFKTPLSNALCVTSLGTAGLEGVVTYSQF